MTGRAEPPTVTLNLTVPASTLTQGGQHPSELAGLGPITAEAVRGLLGAGSGRSSEADTDTDAMGESDRGADDASANDASAIDVGAVRWRRLLTDPATGILVDVTESRYQPSAPLDRAVRARDRTCRFPGCRRPAQATRSGVDLDHTTPWPAGPTSAANLACLCRHHHRLKHSPGWRVEREPDGALHWITPTGHRFTTMPWQYDDPPDQVDDAA